MLELMPERLKAGEFSNQWISVCGKSFVADMSGALFWPSRRAVVVADLVVALQGTQFSSPTVGKADAALARLASVIDKFDASRVIVLGNGVDGGGLDDRLSAHGEVATEVGEDTGKTLSIMQAHCEWTWVAANSPSSTHLRDLGGTAVNVFKADGLTFRDVPTSSFATHEIAGGVRPAATVSRHGHVITRPCFVGNGLRLVLPSFGTIAGGTNVLGDTFAALFESSRLDVLMLGHEGLCPIAPRLLMG